MTTYTPNQETIRRAVAEFAQIFPRADVFLELLKRKGGKNIAASKDSPEDYLRMIALFESFEIIIPQRPEGQTETLAGMRKGRDVFFYQVPEKVFAVLKTAWIRDGKVHWESDS